MTAFSLALILGVAYTGAGVLGLVGLSPFSLAQSVLHLLVGLWGLGAWSGGASARTYARAVALIFGALAVASLFPGLQSAIPFPGYTALLYALTALLGAYYGFRRESASGTRDERRTGRVERRRSPRAPVAYERRQGLYDRRRGPHLA